MKKDTITNIFFTWIITQKDNQTMINNIKGNITVSRTEIEFEVVIDDGKELHDSIIIYSLIVTVLSVTQLLSTFWLNGKVSDSQTKYKCVII